jgi:hypothetical protein
MSPELPRRASKKTPGSPVPMPTLPSFLTKRRLTSEAFLTLNAAAPESEVPPLTSNLPAGAEVPTPTLPVLVLLMLLPLVAHCAEARPGGYKDSSANTAKDETRCALPREGCSVRFGIFFLSSP